MFYSELAKDLFRLLALATNDLGSNPDVAEEEQKGSVVPALKKSKFCDPVSSRPVSLMSVQSFEMESLTEDLINR